MSTLSQLQENALSHAISSVEMEGYKLTDFHKKLCQDVLSGTISKQQCINILLRKLKS